MPGGIRRWMMIALAAGMPGVAPAEQSVSFGDYTIHYSAFTTEMLQPEIAKAYQIQRSNRRALLNISVLKKLMGTTGQPVRAQVSAAATNVHGQATPITMRELNDRGAIYYIGEFPVANEESLKFRLEVTPEGEATPLTAQFDQDFFTR